jgi:hypothetical protein
MINKVKLTTIILALFLIGMFLVIYLTSPAFNYAYKFKLNGNGDVLTGSFTPKSANLTNKTQYGFDLQLGCTNTNGTNVDYMLTFSGPNVSYRESLPIYSYNRTELNTVSGITHSVKTYWCGGLYDNISANFTPKNGVYYINLTKEPDGNGSIQNSTATALIVIKRK